MVTSPSIRLASSKSVSAAPVAPSAFSITIALNVATPASLLVPSPSGFSQRRRPGASGSYRRGDEPPDRLLNDGQVDDGRKHAEHHRQPPYRIVRAVMVEHEEIGRAHG